MVSPELLDVMGCVSVILLLLSLAIKDTRFTLLAASGCTYRYYANIPADVINYEFL